MTHEVNATEAEPERERACAFRLSRETGLPYLSLVLAASPRAQELSEKLFPP